MNIIGSSSPEDLAFVKLSHRSGIAPAKIFKAACDYHEIRATKERIGDFFLMLLDMEVVPVIVESFCREVMVRHVRLKPLGGIYERHP